MRGKGGKAYCMLGFRVPTTSVGARDEGVKGSKGGAKGAKGVKGDEGSKGGLGPALGLGPASGQPCALGQPRASLGPRAKGSKAYCMLGFRVPTTSVGTKGERAKGAKHIVC